MTIELSVLLTLAAILVSVGSVFGVNKLFMDNQKSTNHKLENTIGDTQKTLESKMEKNAREHDEVLGSLEQHKDENSKMHKEIYQRIEVGERESRAVLKDIADKLGDVCVTVGVIKGFLEAQEKRQ